MSFEENVELLKDYEKWKTTVKVADMSPEAYLVDAAKEQAYETLNAISAKLQVYIDAISHGDESDSTLNDIARDFADDVRGLLYDE